MPATPILPRLPLRIALIISCVLGVHLGILWWVQADQLSPVTEVQPMLIRLASRPANEVSVAVRRADPAQAPAKRPVPAQTRLQRAIPAPSMATPHAQLPAAPGQSNMEAALPSAVPAKVSQSSDSTNLVTVGNGTLPPVPRSKVDAVQLPSANADYLDNPPPVYPAISRRLGEQGKVTLRVLISADGKAKQAKISHSSGFERLDEVALRTVLAWRYLPGLQDGKPMDMWFEVPLNFQLN